MRRISNIPEISSVDTDSPRLNRIAGYCFFIKGTKGMKRTKRVAALLFVGFLTFAPPGTLLLGGAFVLGMAYQLLGRNHRIAPTIDQAETTQLTTNVADVSANNAVDVTTYPPADQGRLCATLEALLPPEARGKVGIVDNHLSVAFTIASGPALRDQARHLARDFIVSAFSTAPWIQSAQITIEQPNGEVGLSVKLGAGAFATRNASIRTDQTRNPNNFFNWMEEVRVARNNEHVAEEVYMAGPWVVAR